VAFEFQHSVQVAPPRGTAQSWTRLHNYKPSPSKATEIVQNSFRVYTA